MNRSGAKRKLCEDPYREKLPKLLLTLGLESSCLQDYKAIKHQISKHSLFFTYSGGYKLQIGVKGSIWQVYVRIKQLVVDRRSKRYLQTELRAFLALRYF